MKVAIYPGTFDPITNGHLDIIKRSSKFVDKLVIAVSETNIKNNLFSSKERIEMINDVINNESIKNVEISSFNGLLMNFATEKKANIVPVIEMNGAIFCF